MKITKNYFKAETFLMIGCLFFACQAIAMGRMSEQWELHLEKTIPYEYKAFYFVDENNNEFLISRVDKKVVFSENNMIIKFFDNQLLLTRTKDGRFYLLQKILSEHLISSGDIIYEDQLTVCDYRGEEIWSGKGIGSAYDLSPNGEYVVYFVSPQFHPAYPPTFINKNGVMNSDVVSMKASNLEKWDIEYSKIQSWTFSKTGSLLFVGLSRGSNLGVVAVFDSTGKPIKYFDTHIKDISHIILSGDEKKVFVNGFDAESKPTTEIFDWLATSLIWKLNTALKPANIAGESGGNFLTFQSDARIFRLINSTTGNMVWEKQINPCPGFSIIESKFYQDRIVAYGECGNTGQDSLIFLNHNGELTLHHEFPAELLYNGLDAVDIFNDKLIINDERVRKTGNSISIFRIEKM